MQSRILKTAITVVAAVALTAAAAVDASGSEAGPSPRSKLTMMAPAAPGGGWDLAARESQQVLRGDGLVNNAQVVNVPGAGGTIGLSQFANLPADPTQLMMTGTVMLGAITVNNSPVSLADTTPIAKLAEDYIVFIVPADSPYETLEDFLDDWRAEPHSHPVGGGGLGGTDHLLTGLTAREAGVDPGEINYIPYAGGGEVLTSLLSGTVDIGVSGYNDFADQIEAGRLRALAVSAQAPVKGIDAPTFIDAGVDVSLPNWRGFVAPPGLEDADRDELVEIITEMVQTPAWQDTLARNNWEDAFLAGDDFEEFIADDQARVNEIIEELGL